MKIEFNNTTFTEASLSDLSGSALVSLYNDIAEALSNGEAVPTVRRFADKSTAVSRTWKMLQRFSEHAQKDEAPEETPPGVKPQPTKVEEKPAEEKPAKVEKKATAEKKARTSRGTNLIPPSDAAPLPCREGSKQAILLDQLARPEGATMDDLLKALSGGKKPWTEATVRSGFGWDMKLKGYGVRSNFDKDGVERFFIVLPMTAAGKQHPIPSHIPLKGTATTKKSEA